jgi:Domain of unknown function (DUF4249)
MKPYVYISFILFTSCFLYSCSNTLQIEDEYARKIVIWGAFNSANAPQVVLYASKPIFSSDTSTAYINNAKVDLYEDGVYKCTFTALDSGRYTCPDLLTTGHQYTLEVSAATFDTLRTLADTLPSALVIDSVQSSLLYVNQDGYGITQFYVQGGLKKNKVVGVRTQFGGVTVPNGGAVATVYTCNFIPNFYAFDYRFQDMSCYDSLGFFEVYSPALTTMQHTQGCVYGFIIFSAQSQLLLEKMANSGNLNTNPVNLNLFYEPVYFPEIVKGGYGGVLYYQSLDSLIKL